MSDIKTSAAIIESNAKLLRLADHLSSGEVADAIRRIRESVDAISNTRATGCTCPERGCFIHDR